MPGLSQQEISQLLTEIGRVQELRGVGVGFEGRGMCQVLRYPDMPPGLQTWIIMREREVPAPSSGPPAPPTPEESRLGPELLNMGLSCGAAVMTGAAAATGGAAAPVTGGASLAVTALVWFGAAATAAQCGIATGRVLNELIDPQANDILDSEEWVQRSSQILDAISIAGGVASLGQAGQAAVRLSRASGRPLRYTIGQMGRAERHRLAQDIARYTGQAQTRRQFFRLARQGRVPKIFRCHEVDRAVREQLLNAISAGLSGAGSATSGIIRQVVVHVVEDS
jgi:hypothetical protein